MRWRVRAPTGPDDGVVRHHSGRRHRNRRTKAFVKLYTWKTGFGYQQYGASYYILYIIYYMSLVQNLPKSITGKFRPIGLLERDGKKILTVNRSLDDDVSGRSKQVGRQCLIRGVCNLLGKGLKIKSTVTAYKVSTQWS